MDQMDQSSITREDVFNYLNEDFKSRALSLDFTAVLRTPSER